MTHLTLTQGPLSVELDALGAAVNRWVVHDPEPVDLVLGHSGRESRRLSTAFLGELVGPVANRIAGAGFPWDGGRRTLAANDRGNTLHGGPHGFSTRAWEVVDAGPDHATFGLTWVDPDGGFPATYRARVTYTLDESSLSHRITVEVDQPTLANPTSHPYFNLAGGGDVLDHVLTVAADAYLPLDASGIPLPEAPAPVAGTPFDLRGGVRLGDVVADAHPQVALVGGGIDHAFVLTGGQPAAVLEHPATGRRLEVFTDRPSLQVYTGNHLGPESHLRTPPLKHAGVALETQGFPDAPNRPDFPSIVIAPGRPLVTETSWRLSRR